MEITLTIPDELAQRLRPVEKERPQIPDLGIRIPEKLTLAPHWVDHVVAEKQEPVTPFPPPGAADWRSVPVPPGGRGPAARTG